MEFHSEEGFRGSYRPPVQPHEAMATAAVVLSVFAVATSCCIYASLTCGALSIILALLARGQQKKLPPQGRLAVTTSVAAMILTVVMTVVLMVETIWQYGSLESFFKAYSDMMESLTGTALFFAGGL